MTLPGGAFHPHLCVEMSLCCHTHRAEAWHWASVTPDTLSYCSSYYRAWAAATVASVAWAAAVATEATGMAAGIRAAMEGTGPPASTEWIRDHLQCVHLVFSEAHAPGAPPTTCRLRLLPRSRLCYLTTQNHGREAGGTGYWRWASPGPQAHIWTGGRVVLLRPLGLCPDLMSDSELLWWRRPSRVAVPFLTTDLWAASAWSPARRWFLPVPPAFINVFYAVCVSSLSSYCLPSLTLLPPPPPPPHLSFLPTQTWGFMSKGKTALRWSSNFTLTF